MRTLVRRLQYYPLVDVYVRPDWSQFPPIGSNMTFEIQCCPIDSQMNPIPDHKIFWGYTMRRGLNVSVCAA
jgi:hypothetical protein